MRRYAPTGIRKSLHATSQMEQLPAQGPRGKTSPKRVAVGVRDRGDAQGGFNKQEGMWPSDGLLGRRVML